MTWLACAKKNRCELGARILGHIRISLKVWNGISGYHHRLVSKSHNMQEVVEALHTGTANREAMDTIGDGDQGSSSSNSSSSSSSFENEGNNEDHRHHHLCKVKNVIRLKKEKAAKALKKNKEQGDNDDDGKRGPIEQYWEYKDHSYQVQRRNRDCVVEGLFPFFSAEPSP